MTSGRRIALLVAVVVVAVVGFIVLKPDEGSKQQTATPADTTAATTPQGETTKQPEQPPSPPIARIEVKDGKPVGGVRKLEFAKGDTVEFVVDSDVADEVHVHGYDVMRDVAPGKPVRFEFEGDIDGQFEVELEDRAEQIASLKVTP
jgi:hypothetical protein